MAGKFTKPADTGNTRPVDLGGAKSGKVVLKGQSKNLVALQHIQYITGRYICQPFVTLAADFFFRPSRLLVCGHQEWG